MHEASEFYWVDNHYHLMTKSQSKNSYVQDTWKSNDQLTGLTGCRVEQSVEMLIYLELKNLKFEILRKWSMIAPVDLYWS